MQFTCFESFCLDISSERSALAWTNVPTNPPPAPQAAGSKSRNHLFISSSPTSPAASIAMSRVEAFSGIPAFSVFSKTSSASSGTLRMAVALGIGVEGPYILASSVSAGMSRTNASSDIDNSIFASGYESVIQNAQTCVDLGVDFQMEDSTDLMEMTPSSDSMPEANILLGPIKHRNDNLSSVPMTRSTAKSGGAPNDLANNAIQLSLASVGISRTLASLG
ncbi:hypothetical protein FRC17_011259 [Serendipita sp. 399]|nr:hypothetical protein FRC17_011259 [Serendipita sp. 399]